MAKSNDNGIAIVGMDCRYPGAQNIDQYLENILSLRRAFRKIPRERLSLDDYFSANRSDPDSTYSTQAAVLSDYKFDRVRYRVSKDTFVQTDMTHWLALDVANGALKDAGFAEGVGLDKERTGVILGNSLTGEFSRSYLMRLRWPYVRRVFQSVLKDLERSDAEAEHLLARTESLYKSVFAPPNADTLAGGLSNTIAGRICNYFNFNGGGYTVDGACSSSLLAFVQGCNALAQGDLDTVLVGGVDLSIDPFEIIGFARAGALAEKEMRVFDARSEGFWPGEGCGVVVMMRSEDARAKGLSIYAEIKGWGISSDGSGGITRPKAETQRLAMRRAYERAGYGIGSVAYFEGHGTGTPVGDTEELTALCDELKAEGGLQQPAVVGSVKELIGHTKAAAGSAGLIKAVLALKHRLIPHSLPGKSLHPILAENSGTLIMTDKPRAYDSSETMRASVSGMGFGGINVHLTLEASHKNALGRHRLELLSTPKWDAEVFPIAAANRELLQTHVESLATWVATASLAELTDLSGTLCANMPNRAPWRAVLIANTPDELVQGLRKILVWLNSGESQIFDTALGVFGSSPGISGKIGFLFPGQGTPIHLNAGVFSGLTAPLKNYFSDLPEHLETFNTALAQPSIMAASLSASDLLSTFGIEASLAIGHSLGEITALCWSGALEADAAMMTAKERGSIMNGFAKMDAGMIALQCDASRVNSLLEESGTYLSCLNGRQQFVVGGRTANLAQLEVLAQAQGIPFTRLKVNRAFHTPLMNEAQVPFQEFLTTLVAKPVSKPVYSTITGALLEQEDWKELLVRQLIEPVRFQQAMEKASQEVDFFIEVGPGQPLCKALQNESGIRCVPLDFGSKTIRGFLHALGASFCSGHNIPFSKLFENRFHRPVNIERVTEVLINPCELAPHSGMKAPKPEMLSAAPEEGEKSLTTTLDVPASNSTGKEEDLFLFLKDLVALKTEIPVAVLTDSDKILSGLHLNSLVISDIIAQVAKRFKKSHETFSAATILASADATLGEIARKMEAAVSIQASAQTQTSTLPDTEWVHVFAQEWQGRPLSGLIQGESVSIEFEGLGQADWQDDLKSWSQPDSKQKGILFLSHLGGIGEVGSLLTSLKNAARKNSNFFLLVESNEAGSTSLAPVVRTFKLENSNIRCGILQVTPGEKDLAKRIQMEISRLGAFADIKFEDGKSYKRVYKAHFGNSEPITKILNIDSVILATGGGKGITFESARELARRTGAKLGLIGRAVPLHDSQLNENLKSLTAEGITYFYQSGNVLDASSIKSSVEAIRAALGEPTLLLHGAGINHPKRIDILEVEDFNATSAVKVQGLRNVLAALDQPSLKYLVAYGSIIARSGMQGNADYAFANEALAVEVENFQKARPDCRCLVLEWSVWDETGMGATLNTLDSLRLRGVFPIPVKRGNEILMELMGQSNTEGTRFVVTGRYGDISTLSFATQPAPFCRFTTDVKRFISSVEITARALLSRHTDLYFDHHRFKGQYVFPTVMALEAMTQAASALFPGGSTPKFSHLRIFKPILVPAEGNVPILIVVERKTATQFKASIRLEDELGTQECFSAQLDFINLERGENNLSGDWETLDMQVASDIYDPLLFHTGPFRRIENYTSIDAWQSCAIAKVDLTSLWFSAEQPQTLLLGDPGLNDAAIHCHQACRPHYNLLPSGLSSLEIFNVNPSGPIRIETQEVAIEGRDILINVQLFDANEHLVQRWTQMRMTPVTGTRFDGPWTKHLIVPYLQHKINDLFGERVAISQSTITKSTGTRLQAITAAGDTQFLIRMKSDQAEAFELGEWSYDQAEAHAEACILIHSIGLQKIEIRKSSVTILGLERVS